MERTLNIRLTCEGIEVQVKCIHETRSGVISNVLFEPSDGDWSAIGMHHLIHGRFFIDDLKTSILGYITENY